jgi:hypothetical protein
MKAYMIIVSALFLTLTQSTLYAEQQGQAHAVFGSQILFQGPDGNQVSGYRCGVGNVTPPIEMLDMLKEVRQKSSLKLDTQTVVSIPVAFHVITTSSGGGDVPNSRLQAQIDVLNAAYRYVNFFITSIDRTANDNWFNLIPDTAAESNMKQTLAIDPAHTLNFYTLSPRLGLLGWATFPWFYAEDDANHGVVVLNESLPGGSAAPYDEGDTGTHEVGHYLGLFHTFQNSCNVPGDYLNDTPYEASPAYGCPIGRDSCAQAGLDPINNFMDYVDDFCMTKFTRNQFQLMYRATQRFRPGLFAN